MATTITAGNSTNGAAISSDNTGTLDIKTGTGAGTLALNINASQTVTIPGNLVVAGTATVGGVPVGGNYILNSYTSPATGPAAWDANTKKAAGLKAVKVTVVGAGGNGGAAPGPNASPTFGSGGGGGGTTVEYIPAPSIPGPVDITAGPGTNSFGAFCSATAGSAGSGNGTSGGAGGAGSGGNFNMPGENGGYASSLNNDGGASLMGTSAVAALQSPSPGAPGNNYGGGGAGGARPNATGSIPGGTGAPGIVIVEEFY